MRSGFIYSMLIAILLGQAVQGVAQATAPRTPMEIFRDSDGNLISNNEFVDIRMANFLSRDATIVTILDDGRKEFRLQKVPQEGMTAPTPVVKTLDGKFISLAELRGKVVVLNFWFIGCTACRAQKPKLNELRAKFINEPDVVFLAMTPDPAADVKRYLAKEPFNYIHAAEAEAELKQFVFEGYPKNIVISRSGEMVYWRSTIHAWEKFESVIRSELATGLQ